jgi:ferredoxin-NADP reductase
MKRKELNDVKELRDLIENIKQTLIFSLDYTAGQYAFFDIGEVYNDPRGPIRHFTVSSSPTEDFIMITTRIRDTPYKETFVIRRRHNS